MMTVAVRTKGVGEAKFTAAKLIWNTDNFGLLHVFEVTSDSRRVPFASFASHAWDSIIVIPEKK